MKILIINCDAALDKRQATIVKNQIKRLKHHGIKIIGIYAGKQPACFLGKDNDPFIQYCKIDQVTGPAEYKINDVGGFLDFKSESHSEFRLREILSQVKQKQLASEQDNSIEGIIIDWHSVKNLYCGVRFFILSSLVPSMNCIPTSLARIKSNRDRTKPPIASGSFSEIDNSEQHLEATGYANLNDYFLTLGHALKCIERSWGYRHSTKVVGLLLGAALLGGAGALLVSLHLIALPLIISIGIGAGAGALLGFGIGYLNSPSHYAIEFPKSEEKTQPEPDEPESRETVFQDVPTDTSDYSQAMTRLLPPASSSSLSDDENILLSDALELIDQICKNVATDPQPLKDALHKYINALNYTL